MRLMTVMAELSSQVFDQTRNIIAADNYNHGNLWTAVGVAITAGMLLGVLTRKTLIG